MSLKEKAKTLSQWLNEIDVRSEQRFVKEAEIENLKAELEKHAWYCIDCDEWHTKGKICVVAEVRKIREEKWRHEA